MVKVIRLVDIRKDVNPTVRPGLRYRDREEQYPQEVVNSGCMRGNDRYTSNGSASVGMYAAIDEPEESSYSDFILFNYGHVHQRQHTLSTRPTTLKPGLD